MSSTVLYGASDARTLASTPKRRRPELTVLHGAVRKGWPKVAESMRLPPRVHEEVRRHLQCGDLRRGFTVVKCDDCAQSQLVAFSCKSRAWCPSGRARRAHETAQHLGEVLPHVPEEVEAVLKRMLRQLLPAFESREVRWPEDEYEALQARAAQLRLPLDEEPAPARRGRLAVLMGFSLHADTATSANDRQGLLRLCRYGARGPVAESRLSRRDDGRYAYETKKGVTLVLTAEQLVKRLIALIVPKGLHLTNFHGVLAPSAAARSSVAPPRVPPPSSSSTMVASTSKRCSPETSRR